jgi:hypothetical protein
MTWTLLANGKPWSVREPDPASVDIETIARALSRIPRFCGHTLGERAYSVAQHSCEVAALMPKPIAIHGLLHDAHEAFIGDIPTPMKRELGGIHEMTLRFDRAIYRGLGLELPDADTEALIGFADVACLNAEIEQLMPPLAGFDWQPYPTPYKVGKELRPKPAHAAEEEFLAAFRRLTP